MPAEHAVAPAVRVLVWALLVKAKTKQMCEATQMLIPRAWAKEGNHNGARGSY